MFGKIKFAFFYWLIWIMIFETARFVFLCYNFRDARFFAPNQIFLTYLYGLRMDASMASYITLPVCLFLLASIFFYFMARIRLYKIYSCVILVPVLLIIFCDLPVYSAWGNRLDASALKYLAYPKEAWASVSNLPVIWIIMYLVFTCNLIYRVFVLFIRKNLPAITHQRNKIFQVFLLLVFSGLQVITLRGGFQLAPLNQSSVYFSKEHFLNLAAVNAPWNFMSSVYRNTGSSTNPFIYLDSSLAKSLKNQLLLKQGNTESVIDPEKHPAPNIIVVVWESFTEKVTHVSKEGHAITPGFNRLKQEGIYFSNIYATGDRTDKGIVAVLSGYPAQPTTSILKTASKAARLPTLPALYQKRNYSTSFYYGGELEFANMKSYLLSCGFQNFTSKSDFDKKDQNSKWGAHDGVVKDKIITDLSKNNTKPFFTTWLTLSSHEPYETPVPTVIEGNDKESLFLNSLHYSDSAVYAFVQQCKKQSWWNNTLMVIVADHGHVIPRTGRKVDEFKIPLLLLGGALKKTGIEMNNTGSQIDIPATVIAQTGIKENPFEWSKDLLDTSSQGWAYFAFNNGFGFVQPNRYFIFDNVGKRMMEQSGSLSEKDIQKGKAIQQESFGDYLKK